MLKKCSIITEGRPSYAQRFAIDWIRLNKEGRFLKGDRTKNENHFSYGLEVLAVADGIVLEVQDGIPDNVPEAQEMAIKMTRSNSTGNHVVLDIGNDVTAVYAHLIPVIIKVEIGEKVAQGQTLGLLGNSGISTGPHLHFHLEKKHKIVIRGEGIPYHFESYDLIHQFESTDDEFIDSLFSGNIFNCPLTQLLVHATYQ